MIAVLNVWLLLNCYFFYCVFSDDFHLFSFSQSDSSESDHIIPHYDDTNWLINCQRPQAEAYLNGKPDGTFLIRPKPEEGNVHVLSIV